MKQQLYVLVTAILLSAVSGCGVEEPPNGEEWAIQKAKEETGFAEEEHTLKEHALGTRELWLRSAQLLEKKTLDSGDIGYRVEVRHEYKAVDFQLGGRHRVHHWKYVDELRFRASKDEWGEWQMKHEDTKRVLKEEIPD